MDKYINRLNDFCARMVNDPREAIKKGYLQQIFFVRKPRYNSKTTYVGLNMHQHQRSSYAVQFDI